MRISDWSSDVCSSDLEADFLWDARDQERWIGAYQSTDDDEIDLDRVRIFGRLDGKWFVAVMIVDGDGNPHGLMGKREFGRRQQALAAFTDACGSARFRLGRGAGLVSCPGLYFEPGRGGR